MRFRFTAATIFCSSLAIGCAFDGVNPGGDDGVGSPDAAESQPDAGSQGSDAAPGADAPIPPTSSIGHIYAHPVVGTPPVFDDSSIADWAGADIVSLVATSAEHNHAAGAGLINNTVKVAAVHDASYLYLMVEVEDADLFSEVAIGGGNLGDRVEDGVEIYFDTANDRVGAWGDDDRFAYFQLDGTGAVTTGFAIEAGLSATPAGYAIEYRIPKTMLGSASDIGFNLTVFDDDDGGNLESFTIMHQPVVPTCANCCGGEADAEPWCDTTRLGQLTFVP